MRYFHVSRQGGLLFSIKVEWNTSDAEESGVHGFQAHSVKYPHPFPSGVDVSIGDLLGL